MLPLMYGIRACCFHHGDGIPRGIFQILQIHGKCRKTGIPIVSDQLCLCHRIIYKGNFDLCSIFNRFFLRKNPEFTSTFSNDRATALTFPFIRVVKPVRITDHPCDRNDGLICRISNGVQLCLNLLVIVQRHRLSLFRSLCLLLSSDPCSVSSTDACCESCAPVSGTEPSSCRRTGIIKSSTRHTASANTPPQAADSPNRTHIRL